LSAFLSTLDRYARKEHNSSERAYGSPLSNKLKEALKRFDVKKTSMDSISKLFLLESPFRLPVPRLLMIEELTSKDVTIDFGKKENHELHTRDLIKICSSNKDAWNKLGISEVMESVVAEEDRRKMERAKKREQKKSSTSPSPKANTKAPSKPKVTRSPEADFARAQKEEAAERKQRQEEKNAERKQQQKKKAFKAKKEKKKNYQAEKRRLEWEAKRPSNDGKRARDAQRALDDFTKNNKGK
jgi:hypothetical protein